MRKRERLRVTSKAVFRVPTLVGLYRSEKERNGNAVKTLQLPYRPKNPGSIKYQLTKPANNPIPVTTRTIIFSLVVVGFPAIEGNIKRNKPPTPTTGLN